MTTKRGVVVDVEAVVVAFVVAHVVVLDDLSAGLLQSEIRIEAFAGEVMVDVIRAESHPGRIPRDAVVASRRIVREAPAGRGVGLNAEHVGFRPENAVVDVPIRRPQNRALQVFPIVVRRLLFRLRSRRTTAACLAQVLARFGGKHAQELDPAAGSGREVHRKRQHADRIVLRLNRVRELSWREPRQRLSRIVVDLPALDLTQRCKESQLVWRLAVPRDDSAEFGVVLRDEIVRRISPQLRESVGVETYRFVRRVVQADAKVDRRRRDVVTLPAVVVSEQLVVDVDAVVERVNVILPLGVNVKLAGKRSEANAAAPIPVVHLNGSEEIETGVRTVHLLNCAGRFDDHAAAGRTDRASLRHLVVRKNVSEARINDGMARRVRRYGRGIESSHVTA